jgi:DNA ligase (NAD+)
MDELRNARYEDLTRVPEIGPEVAKSILLFFEQESTKQLLKKLERAGVRYEKKAREVGEEVERILAGKTFVFTGRISMPREEAKDIVERLGGKVASSVSKKVDFVVAGEEAGSKFKQAIKLGVKIINEAEFRDMVGQSQSSP